MQPRTQRQKEILQLGVSQEQTNAMLLKNQQTYAIEEGEKSKPLFRVGIVNRDAQ